MSRRQDVLTKVKETPEITYEELREIFPDVKPDTLKTYYYIGKPAELKRKVNRRKRKKRSRVTLQRIKAFEYMRDNPDFNLGDLEDNFQQISSVTVKRYFNEWHKAMETESTEELLQGRRPFAAIRAQEETILDSLKKTIDAQKMALDAQKEEIRMLRDRINDPMEGLDRLSPQQAEKVKSVLGTFIKGLDLE